MKKRIAFIDERQLRTTDHDPRFRGENGHLVGSKWVRDRPELLICFDQRAELGPFAKDS